MNEGKPIFSGQSDPSDYFQQRQQPIISVGSKASTDRRGKNNKWLLFIVIIISTVVLLSGIWLFQKNDFGSKEEYAKELYNSFGWVSFTGQCPRVSLELANYNYSEDDYQVAINDCQKKANRIQELMENLDGWDNEEFRSIYSDVKIKINSIAVFGDELEKELKIYAAWHKWLLNSREMDYYQLDRDIENIARPLLESGDNDLIAYGEGWVKLRKTLVMAYVTSEVFPDNSEAQESLALAELEMSSFIESNEPQITELTTIGSGDKHPDELRQALNKLRDYIEENYENK